MDKSTKLLIIFSLFLIVSGLGFLLFGLGQNPQIEPIPSPSVITESPVSIATGSATQGVEGERVLVTKVVDGDTLVINGSLTVRLIGIDTPETVDPRRPVGCFGKEASNKVKELLSGKEVILQKDVSETDKYKRLLRYVFLPLPDGQILFVNDYLVRDGYAKVLTYPPDVKYNEQFRQAETEARENNRGLWGKCN
ncbi:MAG: thermonuclease family protein [Candidatus Daviesbacteria bacterium]|nr:thermonuclease family protein [Candidatus Daviesbacteria bacterium]